jgi:hypothetical protein
MGLSFQSKFWEPDTFLSKNVHFEKVIMKKKFNPSFIQIFMS